MVRPVPGWSQDNNHCRCCHNEIETLTHVLGSCPFGKALRNSRHHHIHLLIAQALHEKHLPVHEEVPGIADNSSTRRVDIIATTPDASAPIILDPTVRFESYADQPIEVNLEKRNICLPARRAGSNGSMSVSSSAGPGFDPWWDSKF